MQEKIILEKLSYLPEFMKLEALHYIEYLIMKHHKEKESKPKRPKFGSATGKYEMTPDFDEPLEDFKEYMY